MFGIKPGALSDASLSDKLMALGSALSGDMEGVKAIRERREREKLASLLASELGSGRTLPQAQPQAQPEPAPAPRIDLVANAASNVTQSLMGSQGLERQPLGGLRPEVLERVPILDPTPQQGLYDRVLPRLIEAAGKGIDISGLTGLIQREDYVRSLPQKDQAAARLDPSRHSGWQREDTKPVFNETSPGNTWGKYDPATGQYTPIHTAPQRELPMNMSRLTAEAWERYQAGNATPEDLRLIKRYEAGSDGFYGERAPPRERTVTARQQLEQDIADGKELTPGQQRLLEHIQSNRSGWSQYMNPGGTPGGDALGDEGDRVRPAPARPAAATPAPNLPRKPAATPAPAAAKVGTPTNPARPKDRNEAAALPRGTWFRDPSGNLIQKK